MPKPKIRFPSWVWIACLLLALARLWLTAGQTIWAMAPTPHDDVHFLTQAQFLLQGRWLGPYSEYTLIKGPFFPVWIAVFSLLHVPLLLSTGLLYILACGLLTAAVRPLLRREAFVPLLFGILLLNPESMDTNLTRVVREMITPALAMLVAAGVLGALLRQGLHRGRSWPWATEAAVSFAVLWLTREEELIVVPFLLLVVGTSAWMAWSTRDVRIWKRTAATWLAAAAVWAAIVYSVAAANFAHYGLFAKSEMDAPTFVDAYGALQRVTPAEFRPLVPVARETRKRIYAVSPAFRELRPFIEGIPGIYWESYGDEQRVRSNRNEILGGWFLWAFRDAVAGAGYYSTGAYPAEYFTRLAGEINAACDAGSLECYAPRRTLGAVWHNSYVRQLVPEYARQLRDVVTFRNVYLGAAASKGSPAELALFRSLTRNEISPTGMTRPGGLRQSVTSFVLRAYQVANPILALAALLAYGYSTLVLVRRRRNGLLWMTLTSLIVLCAARLALISLLDVITYRVPAGQYVQDVYGPMLAVEVLAVLGISFRNASGRARREPPREI